MQVVLLCSTRVSPQMRPSNVDHDCMMFGKISCLALHALSCFTMRSCKGDINSELNWRQSPTARGTWSKIRYTGTKKTMWHQRLNSCEPNLRFFIQVRWTFHPKRRFKPSCMSWCYHRFCRQSHCHAAHSRRILCRPSLDAAEIKELSKFRLTTQGDPWTAWFIIWSKDLGSYIGSARSRDTKLEVCQSNFHCEVLSCEVSWQSEYWTCKEVQHLLKLMDAEDMYKIDDWPWRLHYLLVYLVRN